MSDVSLGAFYVMLEYKANWNGRVLVKIDRFFPSCFRHWTTPRRLNELPKKDSLESSSDLYQVIYWYCL